MGKAKEEFIFHKSFLCSLAPFFRAALEGHFKEASEEAITMPEETPMVVRRFQLWAYSGSILQDDETAKEIDWDIFVRLYIFAERYVCDFGALISPLWQLLTPKPSIGSSGTPECGC